MPKMPQKIILKFLKKISKKVLTKRSLCYIINHVVERQQRDVAQFGRAPGLGPGCRRFESCHPDQEKFQSKDWNFFILCETFLSQGAYLLSDIKFPRQSVKILLLPPQKNAGHTIRRPAARIDYFSPSTLDDSRLCRSAALPYNKYCVMTIPTKENR